MDRRHVHGFVGVCRASTTATWCRRRKLLTTYAEKLQRPDGLFIHAVDGPHAWGRGNGFALLGLTEALTHLPDRLARSRRACSRSIARTSRRWRYQSDDGSWRQVLDEPPAIAS